MATPDAATQTEGVQERLAGELEKIVTRRIAEDQLVLPAIPAVAARCLALTRNASFSLQDAATIIERDPILAAQMFKLVGSAAMATREPATTVLQAVTRLGLEKLRSFLIESAARQMFQSRDTRIAEASRVLWEHSLAVAVLARDVVALAKSGEPEHGYLAGLLHDIGKPIVATMLLEAERALRGTRVRAAWISDAEWIGVVQRCHRPLGLALAQKWEMPDSVCKAIRDCEEYDTADRLSPANAVRFSNALTKQLGVYVGPVSKDDNDALVMIGKSLLNLDEDVVRKLTSDLKGSIKKQM